MDRKNHELRIKLTAEELKIIKTKSRSLGLTCSAFLRVVGLKSNIVTQ